jgi:hypothetical protein
VQERAGIDDDAWLASPPLGGEYEGCSTISFPLFGACESPHRRCKEVMIHYNQVSMQEGVNTTTMDGFSLVLAKGKGLVVATSPYYCAKCSNVGW